MSSALRAVVRHRKVHVVSCLRSFQIDSSNPFVEKYRKKLISKAEELGVNSIEELSKICCKKEEPKFEPVKGGATERGPRFSPVKSLSSYIDIDKAKLHNAKEIELLWRARHSSDPLSLCAAIPSQVYQRMHIAAQSNPMFVLPLCQEKSGVEIHLLQWAFPETNVSHVMITPLGEYKLKGEYSRPHTVMSHFCDFAKDKGIVLMSGTVQDTRVSLDDASLLALSLQKFYAANCSDKYELRRRQLLEAFTRGQDFDVSSLIEETDRV